MGYRIMRDEFEKALVKLKNNKAPGFDKLKAEPIKNSGNLLKERCSLPFRKSMCTLFLLPLSNNNKILNIKL